MVKIIKFLFGFIVAISLLSSCTIDKVIDYSFYVEKHGDYKSDGLCFGIDDQPRQRLLVTDCGGYQNVITSVITLGLSRSSQEVAAVYSAAASRYLEAIYSGCEISVFSDLGGKIFEVFYSCSP